MPVKSHKVQLEARHSSKQSDSERDFEGKTSMNESAFEGKRSMLESASEGKKSMLEQCFRALSGLKARSSSDFECSVASKEKETCSSFDFERSEARVLCISSAQTLQKARSSVISSAQWLRSTLEQ